MVLKAEESPGGWLQQGVLRDTTEGSSTKAGTSLGTRELTTSSGLSLIDGRSDEVHYLSELSAQSFQSAVSAGGAAAICRGTATEGAFLGVGSKSIEEIPAAPLDPRFTDLNHYHDAARFIQVCNAGSFTKVRGLSDCCRGDGKVELYTWDKLPPGSSVVVKRVATARVFVNQGKEKNEYQLHMYGGMRDAEDTLSELGVYCYLASQKDVPQFILRMYAEFQSGLDTWLCLEHAESGDLFNMVQLMHRAGGDVSAVLPRVMLWMWQLMHAVGYMHKHGIGHRDISIENVLLRGNDIRLMDFGQAVRTHTADHQPLRYFSAVGKPYYRPPESYVPREQLVQVEVPEGASADDVVFTCAETSETMCLCEVRLPRPLPAVGETCTAMPWGYAVAPMDVWACAICFFVMVTGMPPWRQAIFQDPHFQWVNSKGEKGIDELLKAWRKSVPAEAVSLLGQMLRPPSTRPTAEECLTFSWFSAFKDRCVEVQEPTQACQEAAQRMEVTLEATKHGRSPPRREPSSGSTTDSSHTGAVGDAGGELSSLVATSGKSGDFYTSAEAHRSVPEASLVASGFSRGDSVPFGGAAGDFYGGGDVYRSTCPATLPVYEPALAAPKSLQRFSCDDLPPALRIDPGFTLEPTTFHSVGSSPADVGNHLLDFMTGSLGACIKKVNPKKYTVKADIRGETGVCTVKVRIYSEGESKFAVEFQRRGGDPMRLHEVFEQAEEYLGQLAKSLAPFGTFEAAASDAPDPFEAHAVVNDTENVLDMSPLSQWTEPGVRGLLQRRRRPPVPTSPVTSAPSSPVPPECPRTKKPSPREQALLRRAASNDTSGQQQAALAEDTAWWMRSVLAEKISQLKKTFKSADKDDSGCFARNDIIRVFMEAGMCTEDSLSVMFEAFDTKKDGTINYNELIDWLFVDNDDAGADKEEKGMPQQLAATSSTAVDEADKSVAQSDKTAAEEQPAEARKGDEQRPQEAPKGE